jgi:DNA (cytosine-5)-methyltransferase 1
MKFIDLFSGIGGFHLAFSELGGKCVFASEIDSHARKTYLDNFEDAVSLDRVGLFNEDIKGVMPSDIPDFDVLCAGFPCQPFSQAGKKKGFDDVDGGERGNLFFNIADIIQEKQPKAFFLENVRGLINHDNGNTLKTIKHILKDELGYSFYMQVVKACDYGLPQLRPRVFIIGFKNDFLDDFTFPEKKPLLYTMSDILGGKCSRDIGFTLRVGGRGSKIHDRRNWEFYNVDGEVKRVTSVEAKIMQGYPNKFKLPKSETQAMKQLGNTVAVNAVKEVGISILDYLKRLDKDNEIMLANKKGKNKGDWTELFAFIKLINDRKVYLADANLDTKSDCFDITKITTENLDKNFCLLDNGQVKITDKHGGVLSIKDISSFINNEKLSILRDKIVNSTGRSFNIEEFSILQSELGISVIKGGNSKDKSDIVLDFLHNNDLYENSGFGIKSYLGSKPTLLNASGNTNFIFKVIGIGSDDVASINSINSKGSKIKDKIDAIYMSGGSLQFHKAEKDSMNYNLKMIDTCMPDIVGHMLISHYKERCSSIQKIASNLIINKYEDISIYADDHLMLEDKIKRLLVSILLGFFAGNKWDGQFLAKGTLVVKNSGDIVAFHIIDIESLKDYLFDNIKVDTPSSSRHKFGYLVDDGKEIYIKLNLQLRF